METLKQFFRAIIYGRMLDYHLKKKEKYDDPRYNVLLHYHFEKAQYYYEKTYEKPFDSNQSNS